jgi:DNA-binding CsgD family transcriptional regulator
MAALKNQLSKEQLEQLYLVDGFSTTQIARRLRTNRESVRGLIHNYGIPMRGKGYPFNKRKG